MEDIKIKNFEGELVALCNKTAISNREKYYVLKDVANSLFEASEKDILVALTLRNAMKKGEQDGAE